MVDTVGNQLSSSLITEVGGDSEKAQGGSQGSVASSRGPLVLLTLVRVCVCACGVRVCTRVCIVCVCVCVCGLA